MCLPLLALLPAILTPALSALGTVGTAAATTLSSLVGAFGAGSAIAGVGAGASTGGLLGLTTGQALLLGGTLAASATSTGVSVAQANAAADAQEDLSQQQLNAETSAIAVERSQQTAAAAEENLSIAQEAARARGELQASGLADASLATFLVEAGRASGRASAVSQRNLEFAGRQNQIQQRAAELSSAGRLLDIDANRPSGLTAGLNVAGDTLATGLTFARNADPVERQPRRRV